MSQEQLFACNKTMTKNVFKFYYQWFLLIAIHIYLIFALPM